MRYFPLDKDHFEHQFGIKAIPDGESITEQTDAYLDEITLARRLLGERESYYFQTLTGTESAQREAARLIVNHASHLQFTEDGRVRNRRTDETFTLSDNCSLLDIGRHVQEDLTIMSASAGDGHPLIAGKVCFPSGWCIGDKLGQSILAIHRVVPEFETALGDATARLMERLKPGRPVWRTNWGVRPSCQLDQSPRHAEDLERSRAEIHEGNVAERCFFRVERQTLARLPETGCILFAIHTHQQSLGELSRQEQRSLFDVIRTCPPETLQYKGILPMRDAIVSYLDR